MVQRLSAFADELEEIVQIETGAAEPTGVLTEGHETELYSLCDLKLAVRRLLD